MSIRRVTCPGCGTSANVPAAMTNAKCSKCATVWNINQPAAATPAPNAPAAKATASANKKSSSSNGVNVAMLGGLIGGVMLLMIVVGIVVLFLSREPAASTSASSVAAVEETIKPATPEPYREIRKPEETRKRIYNDYRKLARTTTEKPLAIPGGNVRGAVEGMLQATADRELTRFAALHDVTVEDIKEVIKEGDAKGWDGSPRSNATRDGKRVYPEEMSEGWERNKNRK